MSSIAIIWFPFTHTVTHTHTHTERGRQYAMKRISCTPEVTSRAVACSLAAPFRLMRLLWLNVSRIGNRWEERTKWMRIVRFRQIANARDVWKCFSLFSLLPLSLYSQEARNGWSEGKRETVLRVHEKESRRAHIFTEMYSGTLMIWLVQ